MITRTLTPDPPGAALTKCLICLAQARGDVGGALALADQHCRPQPTVAATLKAWDTRHKSGVGAGTIAGALAAVDPYGVGRDFWLLLQSASILGRLAPQFRRIPFRTRVSREFGAGAAGVWTGEGLPRLVRQTTFDLISQEVYSADVTLVVTRELFRFGNVAEATLRAALVAGLARFLDGQLLDPAVSATAARPASVTNGAAAVTSSGSTAAAICTDLDALLAAIDTPGDGLTWVMRRTTFARLAAKLASVGLMVAPGTLCGLPVVAGSGSPQQIALIDTASIAYASDEIIGIDLSTETSVEMVDASSQDATTGTGAQLVNMLQTGSVALRASLPVAWQGGVVAAGSPSRPAGVAYMTVEY